MTAAQLAFDFAQPVTTPAARRHDFDGEARAYWRVGMVTSLRCFCMIEGGEQRYTQMLPGVVEAIAGDLASVRIYAAPEYGYRLENYPLHLALAVNVPLRDLGRYGLSSRLQWIVDAGLLATGDPEMVKELRKRSGRVDFAPGCAIRLGEA
jgi:hypothetical protein